jgi:hypothetical protein
MRYGIIDVDGRIRVKLLADAIAEAAYNPPDGSLAYRTDTGQFRFRSGGAWISPSLVAGSAIVNWGNNSVGATTTTRYMEPWFDDTLAPTSPTQWFPPRPGTATNARMRHNVPAGNGEPIVYTLRKNGVGTALSISLPSTTSDSAIDADAIALLTTDFWDIEVTKAASVGTSPTNIIWTMEYRG